MSISEESDQQEPSLASVQEANLQIPSAGWLIGGCGALGANVGFLAGLSSAAITLPLVAAIFTLAGGGVVTILTKLAPGDRSNFGKALTSFCIACLMTLVIGVVIKANRFLDLPGHPIGRGSDDQYLKSETLTLADKLEMLCRRGDMNAFRDALNGVNK